MDSSKAQANDLYGCKCGINFEDQKKFKFHLLKNAKLPEHGSLGRISRETGEVTMPPWPERTKAQKASSTLANKKEGEGKEEKPEKGTTVRATELPNQATEIRLTPRFYTMDYSPIIRMAQAAAIKYFGWRPEMPLGNFIDTVLYLYFKEKGITLCGYIVDDELAEELTKETEKEGVTA